ncbi:MAG: DNA replication/repair protein RecF [Verrucomicrobia bacterium]|nr:DNA replication/repair protein RecF [Verrucomicrobiota bacterium]
MWLQHLVLRNFRNYEQAQASFCPSVNVIYGDNGQGKTNLLEAIYLISTGRSFRTKRLSDLIRTGANYFYVEAHFSKDGISQCIKIFYDEQSRKVQTNNTVHNNFNSLLGTLPGILLSPEDHALMSGSPADRRKFIDLHIAQIDPLYVYHLGRYFRAMKQRNHLLKSRSEATLAAWEMAMAPSAAYIIEKRKEALVRLGPPIGHWMDHLSHRKDSLTAKYDCSFSLRDLQGNDLVEYLQAQWKKSRSKEMHLGSTLLGPHRDDLSIAISEKDAKNFSSEGQKRCGSSALRFAQWEQFYALIGAKPLLGIDDFGIQLDPERQKLLQQKLPDFGQVFLTTPVLLQIDTAHALGVQNGQLGSLAT